MKEITRSQKDKLAQVGLLKEKKNGYNKQDPNYSIANKRTSRSKTYFLVENPTEMRFLGYFVDGGIIRISNKSFERLKTDGCINDTDIQNQGEYNPRARVYFWDVNTIYVVKDPKILNVLFNKKR